MFDNNINVTWNDIYAVLEQYGKFIDSSIDLELLNDGFIEDDYERNQYLFYSHNYIVKINKNIPEKWLLLIFDAYLKDADAFDNIMEEYNKHCMSINTYDLNNEQITNLRQYLAKHDIIIQEKYQRLSTIKAYELPKIIDDINKILSIVKYNLDEVAYYVIIDNYFCFNNIDEETNIEQLTKMMNDKKMFSEAVHDARQIEIAITEALYDITNNAIWYVLQDKMLEILEYDTLEVSQTVDAINDKIYDKIIARIDEIAYPFVIKFCKETIDKIENK